MTVCLAGFSHRDRTIVMVSDRMSTIGNRTADNSTHKWNAIHGDWCVEFAGDAGIASLVLTRAIPFLAADQPHTSVAVADAMERAVADERGSLVCAQHGLTTEQLSHLKPVEMRRLVRQTPVGCDFLVAGFDPDARPHVLVVRGDDGKARDCSSIGYWCVGSGDELALASLGAREQNMQRWDTVTTVYHLLEARFEAEADANVGKDETLVLVIRHRSYPTPILPYAGIQQIKSLWLAHRRGYAPGVLELTRSVMESVHAI